MKGGTMSRLRNYIASTDNVNFERVLDEWDIPLDENLTALEANMWLHAQLHYHEEIVLTCVIEGLDSEEWDAAVEFVWKCLKNGVVPHEYVNLLIKQQQAYNEFYS
jgi:hypothetical protein